MTDAPRTPGEPPAEPRQQITLIHVLAGTTAVIGVLMIVLALASGGGLGSYGVLVGAFFIAAGVARLRLLSARAKARR